MQTINIIFFPSTLFALLFFANILMLNKFYEKVYTVNISENRHKLWTKKKYTAHDENVHCSNKLLFKNVTMILMNKIIWIFYQFGSFFCRMLLLFYCELFCYPMKSISCVKNLILWHIIYVFPDRNNEKICLLCGSLLLCKS
jgi:hypothetical protein